MSFEVSGQEFTVGHRTANSDVDAKIQVKNPRFFRRVLAAGNLGLGEAYIDRDFEMEVGTLQEFLTIMVRNRLGERIKLNAPAAVRVAWLRLTNALRGKTRNVQRHYDIGDDLFEALLDSTLTYSCGYAKKPTDDLDQLQFNKLDRICRKLGLRRGERLLDIGCGYGGLLIHAAKHYGVSVTGVTISRHHYERAKARAAEQGLTARVDVQFRDFTDLSGKYDKIVSVGMMEHVPRSEYRKYFNQIYKILEPHGVGLVHTIGANAPTNQHDPFIQKYIFPHSNQPRLSEICEQLEIHRLAILDVENMVRHYRYTTERWLENFHANRDRLDATRYDDAFVRMWEYYLCCGIAAATASDSALYQVLFNKDYAASLPLHRV